MEIKRIHIKQDKYLNELERYAALAKDWHRLRDTDVEWRYFQKIVTRVVVGLAALFVIGALTGCDSPEKRCDRWTATVESYEMCAGDAKCRSVWSRGDYKGLSKARIERARWCPEEKP